MKLLIVCRSFNNMAGGIERMATALMNDMCERGHEVSLLTWDLEGAESFYELHPNITWYNVNLGTHDEKASWSLRLKRMKRMRHLLNAANPDIVLAFQHGTFLSTRLYSAGQGFPIIAAEREAPSRFDHLKAGKWQWLIYQSFRLAKNITIQCKSYIEDYPDYLRNKIMAIPNPVFPATHFANPQGNDDDRKKLISVGRLGYQKNQSALLKAFAQIKDQFPDWDLLLAGEGGDRNTLEQEIQSLDLTKQVFLLGAVKDIKSLYCASHLSCLSARWEGFPNVIAESLSHGLPAVGYAGCAGTRDLIEDGVNGLLAEGNGNPDTLAQALATMMSNPDLRGQMGKAGIESMKEFVPKSIFDRWEIFLTGAVKT